jgi:uncharacterized protein YegP (UPF0339 family)
MVSDTAAKPANDQTEWYFEIYRVPETQLSATFWSGGDWRWRFCAPDGKTIAAGVGYDTGEKCRAAVTALLHHASKATIYALP